MPSGDGMREEWGSGEDDDRVRVRQSEVDPIEFYS